MRTVTVNASKNYEIRIGSGLIKQLGNTAQQLGKVQKVCIVSDTHVWDKWGHGNEAQRSLENAGFEVISFVFPAGEESKNASVYLDLLNHLAQNRLTRSDLIVALGGGVVGDLAGFAAATYLRGIRFIQVPTTLLAAVDSSVGGKTAIDLPAGKNLCGAFCQPSCVLCDTDLLKTLPEDVFQDGCAEVIKYGVLYDPDLFAYLEETGLAFDREAVIARCVELKRDVVMEDEYDTGERMKLNLGHTIGHGVEAKSNFAVSHGKAVAIGMAIVSQAAVKRGLCQAAACNRILNILNQFGLPVTTEYSAEDLYSYTLSDKKRSGGSIRLIIPREIGNCGIFPTPVEELKEFIQQGLTMDLLIFPGKLSGELTVIPSKSLVHRILICAAFSDDITEFACSEINRDILATAECLEALGVAHIQWDGEKFIVSNQRFRSDPDMPRALYCRDSGSTLRFLLPIAGALGYDTTFHLEGRLAQRPLSPLWEEMERMGCQLSRPTENTIRCQGRLKAGEYTLDGGVSSQFISGLLMAAALIPGKTTITLTGKIESRPYITMTQKVMEAFGCNCMDFTIDGPANLESPGSRLEAEGDWSNGAFFLVANALGSCIQITNLPQPSLQGDQAVAELLKKLEENCTISAGDIPDLVPILSIVAACRKGSVFTDIRRLRLKESDRVASIIAMLEALGGRAEATENTLTVYGTGLTGGTVNCHNDHRIAMSAAIAATVCQKPVVLLGAECVRKSYPRFFTEYSRLGGYYEQYLW